MSIIDTPISVASRMPCLVSQGVQTIIRYYNFSNSASFPNKRLELAEAQVIASNNIQMAVVFQQRQNQVADFDKLKGIAAGRRAYRFAQDSIGQPPGSAIYFSVDFDASSTEIKNSIMPFFDGIKTAFMEESNGNPNYKTGAYGSGLTCSSLTQKGLIEFTWLAMSRGFRGTKDALKAGDFHLAQRAPEAKLCGIDVDFNDANPDRPDFGAFTIEAAIKPQDANAAGGKRHKVIARSGLRLREGPGTQFDIIGGLRSGQVVFVNSVIDGFARIDVDGDGQVDGFASAGLLEQV